MCKMLTTLTKAAVRRCITLTCLMAQTITIKTNSEIHVIFTSLMVSTIVSPTHRCFTIVIQADLVFAKVQVTWNRVVNFNAIVV